MFWRDVDRGLLVLPTSLVLLIGAGCKTDDIGVDYQVLNLSGVLSSAVLLSDLTEVRVAADLSFQSEADPGLHISGRVRFVVSPDVRITLPQRTLAAANSELSFNSSTGSWQGLTVPIGGRLDADNLIIRNAIAGLEFAGQSSSTIEALTVSDAYNGVSLSDHDTLRVQSIDIVDCTMGVFAENHSQLDVGGGLVTRCGIGAKNSESTLTLCDLVISDCSIAGLWTHLELLTDIQHCRFTGNLDHLYIQNNRNLVFILNDLQDISGNGYPIHAVYTTTETVDCQQNNFAPSVNGWFVNLSQGSLSLENNWWSTSDSLTISNGLYDHRVDPARSGLVAFMPVLSSRVAAAGPR